jgi:chromate transporter
MGFIAPAALLVLAAAALYVHYGPLRAVRGALAGVEPVVVAVVALALWRLAPTAFATRRTALIGVLLLLVLVLAPWLGIADGASLQVAILVAGGLAGAFGAMTPSRRDAVGRHGLAAPAFIGAAASGAAPLVGVMPLFLFFLGVGASVYGSGYVLLAFLHGGLVVRRGWLTDRQLLDAIAIGQVTPGPVFTAATFIGYLLRGAPGAAAATVGIFLPAFGYVAASAPFLARVQRSPVARGALDGVNAAAIAVLASALVVIARAALVDAFAVGVALASLVVAVGTTINPAWIFLAAALLGALAR